MRIKLTSVLVDDQDKALRFYTEVLGFRTKHDIPVGAFRWIMVVSPEGPDDLELALEPNANPAAASGALAFVAARGRCASRASSKVRPSRGPRAVVNSKCIRAHCSAERTSPESRSCRRRRGSNSRWA